MFINKTGYNLVKIYDAPYFRFFTKTMYEFTLDEDDPLTYVCADGRRIQPERIYETDMGSTPLTLQLFFQKDRFLLSYFFHDSVWQHGGLYVKLPHYEDYYFVEMSKFAGNKLLEQMIVVEGGTPRQVWTIRTAVDLAALFRRERT